MIKLLTRKETEFLQKLASLLTDYDAIIVCDGSAPGVISFQIYDGHDEKNSPIPIVFRESVDESDIYSLFAKTYSHYQLFEQEDAESTYKVWEKIALKM